MILGKKNATNEKVWLLKNVKRKKEEVRKVKKEKIEKKHKLNKELEDCNQNIYVISRRR